MPTRWTGHDWPEADQIFRSDARWLGGDDAYSIPLGSDRTLWVFGDSFIGSVGQTRAEAGFVHNTWALQTGLDPSACDFEFFWPVTSDGTPEAVVETGDGTWLWPYDGVCVDGRLVLFFMHVRSTRPELSFDEAWEAEGSLGFFEVFGWDAYVVEDIAGPVRSWVLRRAERPGEDHGGVLGAAVVVEGEHLLAYGHRDDGAILARWDLDRALRGDLTRAEWWGGADQGWAGDVEPAVVLPGALTEFTVHRDEDGTWWQLELTGFAEPTAAVSLRHADAPEGPWSEPEPAHALSGRAAGAMLYAGKAHPELTGADLVVTQVSIGLTRAQTLADPELYLPRFVRLRRT